MIILWIFTLFGGATIFVAVGVALSTLIGTTALLVWLAHHRHTAVAIALTTAVIPAEINLLAIALHKLCA